MAQLGSGNNSSYPHAIDTKQTFVNGTPAAPDSNARLDAELANDTLDALIKIQTALGAMPQGVFGSLAARLQQFFPGGGATPAFFSFVGQNPWTIAGQTHRLGSATLLTQFYDNQVPAQAIMPSEVAIDQTTYDVEVSWATGQSGTAVLAGVAPQYTTTFTDTDTITIPGTTHQLGTGLLLVRVYTNEDPWNILTPADITIDQATLEVVVSLGVAQSGTVVLSAAGPRYSLAFTDDITVTIAGATHGLQSRALLFQVFDAQSPTHVVEPDTVTVDQNTYEVTLTFLTPQSGTVLLVKVPDISGSDFDVRDMGIVDSTATRVHSGSGTLGLQMGSGDAMRFKNRLGTVLMSLLHAGSLGLGILNPTYQLELSTDSAAKLATSTWATTSDSRLKEVLGPFEDGLALLLQLEPVRYRYNGLAQTPQDRQEHVGLLAQAVQPLAPYMVSSRRGQLRPGEPLTDILTLNSHALTFMLLNAIKELTARVVALETALAALGGPAT